MKGRKVLLRRGAEINKGRLGRVGGALVSLHPESHPDWCWWEDEENGEESGHGPQRSSPEAPQLKRR